MRRRTACSLAVGGFAAFCTGTARAAGPDTVRIGVAAISPTYAIYYAAQQLGFYQAANLDVAITQFRGGPASQEALAAGAIDVCAVLPLEVSLAVQKGVREKIVALFAPPQPAGWHIMVNASSPIRSMAALNGKTIGVTQIGSQTDLWVRRAVQSAGISVTSVPLGGGVDAGLRAGQVDAAILWPLFSYKGLIAGDLRSVDDLGTTMRPTVSEGLAASSELMEKRPAVLKRWLAATAQTVAYMHGHEAWTVAFLKRYFNSDADQVVRMTYTNFILKIRSDGLMRPAWMKDALDLAAVAGLPVPPSTGAVFSTAFIPVTPAR